jgi:hypothetical protein
LFRELIEMVYRLAVEKVRLRVLRVAPHKALLLLGGQPQPEPGGHVTRNLTLHIENCFAFATIGVAPELIVLPHIHHRYADRQVVSLLM